MVLDRKAGDGTQTGADTVTQTDGKLKDIKDRWVTINTYKCD